MQQNTLHKTKLPNFNRPLESHTTFYIYKQNLKEHLAHRLDLHRLDLHCHGIV